MNILIVTADGFEDSELSVPYRRFVEEGMSVDIASVQLGPLVGKHGYRTVANREIGEVRAADYDGLLIPGGRAPESLRHSPDVLGVVRDFFAAGKPVFAICHGPQLLVSAGALHGRSATCYRSVAAELRKAGARYSDAEVVVDGNLVTSRQPGDLPAFLREALKKLGKPPKAGDR
ncbi:MAG TPA: type 1 glutamine amidotransferase domain-containing protein [Gammaproteobacteria bacterium]|jgi:protease I|nr:type 1 glutamine amidotransferase domain-containing protein [Gammaproteobacteria bacterium]